MGLTLASCVRLELTFLAHVEELVEDAFYFLREIQAEPHEKYKRGQ